MNDIPIIINSSLISKFIYKDDYINICPKQIYECYILKNYSFITKSMLYGSYFETQCIGSGAYDKTNDLPRIKLTNKQIKENTLALSQNKEILHVEKQCADHIRIDEQIAIFKKEVSERQMNIIQDGINKNVQTKIYKKINTNGQNILISGILDIFPVTMNLGGNKELFIIDLKLSGDLTATGFTKYCWGNAANMDHTQAYMYHELVRDIDYELNPHLKSIIPPEQLIDLQDYKYTFAYWIFDYKPLYANELKIVTYDNTKKLHLYENIRKTKSIIEYYNEKGWNCNPDYSLCKHCPVDCKDKVLIEVL